MVQAGSWPGPHKTGSTVVQAGLWLGPRKRGSAVVQAGSWPGPQKMGSNAATGMLSQFHHTNLPQKAPYEQELHKEN